MTHRVAHSLRLLITGLLFGLLLTACTTAQAAEEEIEAAWAASAHADAEARAFSHWNDDDPAEISENCAKCHSTTGYRNFLGLDGGTPGQVDHPVPVGTTVECEACHNEVAAEKDSAVMPSGITLTDLLPNTNCLECHQGRASGVDIVESTTGLGPDIVDPELSLPRLHNNPAGPTQYGNKALVGYEYPGQSYSGRYAHTAGFDTCVACHNAHSLQIDTQQCSACHLGANTVEDLADIRVRKTDFDGDGNTTEGLAGEIETMQEKLLLAMRARAATQEGSEPINYDGGFVNAAGETYKTWTPRMLEAGYNYQYSTMDLGQYIHNGDYIMQLLYDSLNDLGGITDGMTRPPVKQ